MVMYNVAVFEKKMAKSESKQRELNIIGFSHPFSMKLRFLVFFPLG